MISDDYENWEHNEKHREVAKLLMIDQTDYGVQHIFFDDMAKEEDECVVDVRDVIKQDLIPWRKFINKYVFKVEPHRAILEPDYFIQLIDKGVQARTLEINRIEAGITADDDDSKKVKVEDEWALLQSLPHEEYLMRTILPILHSGMKQVET